MASLFEEYEILARSGLFDAAYYLEQNPDVRALNLDPLAHYIEEGARRGRNPNPDFDTAFYIEQCRQAGENPSNPLLHFLTIGVRRGLKPNGQNQEAVRNNRSSAESTIDRAAGQFVATSDGIIQIDMPTIVDGRAVAPITGNLTIHGWALARSGVSAVDIWIDGKIVASAQYGIRRKDVEAVHPNWRGAATSGFRAVIGRSDLVDGRHVVSVVVRDNANRTAKREFTTEVDPATQAEPWEDIRVGIPQAELDVKNRIRVGLASNPAFYIIILDQNAGQDTESLELSLNSLRGQTYPTWRVQVICNSDKARAERLKRLLAERYADLKERAEVIAGNRRATIYDIIQKTRDGSVDGLIAVLRAGDELGCDAFLEMAIESGLNREGQMFYSDERRFDQISKRDRTFFKPSWSPDLLLSTNYIGQFWCVRPRLFKETETTVEELSRFGEYDLVLRLTEKAGAIVHVPLVLCRRGRQSVSPVPVEQEALRRAIKRREIVGTIEQGCSPSIHRLRRRTDSADLVSIIIPTCAADGLIEKCIATVRQTTSHRNFEIVCIENIPPERADWKKWLRQNADTVIETREPFNWARFNNIAAAKARGEFLLFLNDDIEAIEPDWLTALLEHGQRPEVGSVGPQLLYADRTVQHAGVFLTTMGRARHAFKFSQPDDPGYFGLALAQRDVIAVTGACVLTRTAVFNELGRFNEAHAIINNDLDYGLKVWRQGLVNVFTPYAQLIHHELSSRIAYGEDYDASAFESEWRTVFQLGDPYFHARLSKFDDDFSPDSEIMETIPPAYPIMPIESVRRILVIKLDHIGDCITALPALTRLKESFAEAKVSILSLPSTRGVWSMTSIADEIIECDFFHGMSGSGPKEVSVEQLRALGEGLKSKHFDLAIDLRKEPLTRFVLQYSGARILAGFDQGCRFPWLDVSLEWEGDEPGLPKQHQVSADLINLVEAAANACRPMSFSMPDSGRDLSKAVTKATLGLFDRPVVCIHPAAGTVMRQWPHEYYVELIDLLIEQEGVNIVVIGGADDRDIIDTIAHNTRHPESVRTLAGATSLLDLPALLKQCALFVGNNSGPQHMAAALGVPTIGIHSGVVDSREWGPVGPSAVAMQRKVHCSPCYLVKREDCQRGLACLHGVTPGDVYRVCRRLLAIGSGVQQPSLG